MIPMRVMNCGYENRKMSKIPMRVTNCGYESRKMSMIPTQVMNCGYESRKNEQDTHVSNIPCIEIRQTYIEKIVARKKSLCYNSILSGHDIVLKWVVSRVAKGDRL